MMVIEIDVAGATPRATLAEPADFTSFRVVVACPPHVWVAPETIRGLAGDRASDPAWREALEEMLAFAASRGWTDAEGRVRAHVEAVSGGDDER
jgi:sugar phosphate isomerase/epimerase